MKKESPKLNNQNHPQVDQLQANNQLMSIIEKKIKEEAQKKIDQLHTINIDKPDESKNKCQVKIDEQQFRQNLSNDEDYRPENDASSSQSVQRYKFYRLRLREIKVITKRQFQRKLLPNQPIQIMDDSEHSSANKQKKQYVKVNFKEEVKGRITKKAKMQFLFKKKGKVVRKNKNKKRVKAIHYQLNNQSD